MATILKKWGARRKWGLYAHLRCLMDGLPAARNFGVAAARVCLRFCYQNGKPPQSGMGSTAPIVAAAGATMLSNKDMKVIMEILHTP